MYSTTANQTGLGVLLNGFILYVKYTKHNKNIGITWESVIAHREDGSKVKDVPLAEWDR